MTFLASQTTYSKRKQEKLRGLFFLFTGAFVIIFIYFLEKNYLPNSTCLEQFEYFARCLTSEFDFVFIPI